MGLARTIAAPTTHVAGGVIYRFTGWSDGATANPRIVDVPANAASLVADYKAAGIVPPVTVSGVRTVANRGSVQSFILTFSAALNPTTAQKAAGYWVVLPGRDHRFGTRDDRIVKFRKAVYEASSDMVKLAPGTRLAANSSLEIVVSGSASKPHPTDVWGRPIDGNKDGAPGGNFVATLGPSPAQARPIKLRRVGMVRAAHGAQPASLLPGAVDAVFRNGILERFIRRRKTSP